MGRLGDCKVCYTGRGAEVDASHARGEAVRSIARRIGLPEATVRRHLANCKPKKERAKPEAGLVTRQHLEAVAAEKGIPFADLLRHWVLCLGGDVSTSTDEEAHELCEMAGLLEEGSPCCAETAE